MSLLARDAVSPHTYRPLYAISLGHGLSHWYIAAIPMLMPFIAKDLGLTYTAAGFLLAIRQLAAAAVTVPTGAIIDLIGRRTLMMGVALSLATFPFFLLSTTTNYWLIALLLIVTATGNHLWHPAAIPTFTDMYPDRKGYCNAVHTLGATGGDMLPPLMVGMLITILPWRQVVLANAAPGLIIALLAWLMLRSSPPLPRTQADEKFPSTREYLAGFKALVTNKQVVLLCAMAGLRTLTQVGLVSLLPFYLTDDLRLHPGIAGLYMTTMQFAGVIATPIAGLASDRIGRKTIIGAGTLVSSLAVLLLAFLRLPGLFIVVLAVVGFFLYAARPVIFALSMDITPPAMAGTLVSLLFVAQGGMAAVAPLAGGYIGDHWGLIYAFYFLAGSVLVSNLLLLFIKEDRR